MSGNQAENHPSTCRFTKLNVSKIIMAEKKVGKWQIKDSVLVLDNQWAKVRRDVCLLPDGTEIDGYYYWEGGHFAQVFALTPDDQAILVSQYRHGVREINIELPAGLDRKSVV